MKIFPNYIFSTDPTPIVYRLVHIHQDYIQFAITRNMLTSIYFLRECVALHSLRIEKKSSCVIKHASQNIIYLHTFDQRPFFPKVFITYKIIC